MNGLVLITFIKAYQSINGIHWSLKRLVDLLPEGNIVPINKKKEKELEIIKYWPIQIVADKNYYISLLLKKK